MISIGSNTVARRIEDLGGDIIRQIKEKTKSFCWHSLALDESTDLCDTSQLLVFIRGVDSEFNVTQESASVHSMHSTTTGKDIFNEVSKIITEYNLEWKRVQCMTIDGGKNMSGTKRGLVGQITTAREVRGFSKPIFLHCLIHQQALCLKYVDMSCVMKPVASVVNFIRYHALYHRQFHDFLKEIDSEFLDLPYYAAVRWLSCGKVLLHCLEFRSQIDLFLTEKNKPQPLLSDCEWIWKFIFFADMTGHINNLNLKLQSKTNLISDYFVHVEAFRPKLALLEGQVFHNIFHVVKNFHAESKVEFPSSFANEINSDLKMHFQDRFAGP
ncbi:general transcription factor II-I repeat domain-containing protein 2-like [Artemia franciscana]|uniref:general transcription factor II-I repeat domain-containing protein 2-like n=1 Tax=Artemia franciscana TaxID=6661 RepID=UPI0032DA3B38